jgi:hypothetical protein
MLQCYVLTCGRSVTAFLAPHRSQRPGQGPRSPHPKAGPAWTDEYEYCLRSLQLTLAILSAVESLRYKVRNKSLESTTTCLVHRGGAQQFFFEYLRVSIDTFDYIFSNVQGAASVL